MKKILLSMVMMLVAMAAGATDLYVAGSMNGWAAADAAYKMTETKDGAEWTFTFNVDLVNKEFKIKDADASWAGINLGASGRLDADNALTLVSGGGNIKIATKYKKAENVTITVTKDGDTYKMTAKGGFSTTGEVTIPDFYLYCADNKWKPLDEYKFTKNAANWTYTTTVTDGMAEGFKISTSDWGGYNFGNTGTSIEAGEAYLLYNDGGSSNIIMGESIETGKTYLFTLVNSGDDWNLTITQAEESAINAATVESNGNRKFIENGAIVILKNGVKYNVAGQIVK